jgi:phage major head subunit gpT-like protein
MSKKRRRHWRDAILPEVNASSKGTGKVAGTLGLANKPIAFTAPVEFKAAAAPEDGQPAKVPTFSIVAYTGGPLVVAGWDRPVVVDIAGLQVTKSRPVLREHDPDRIVGHTTIVAKQPPRVLVDGVASGKGKDADEVRASAADGFPWQASIGVTPRRVQKLEAGSTANVNGIDQQGPAYIVRHGFLKEVSFVALGADDETSATIAAGAAEGDSAMSFEDWAAANGFDLASMTAEAVAKLKTLYALDQAETAEDDAEGETETEMPAAAASASGKGTINATIATDRKAQAAELARVHAIKRTAAANPDIAAKAILEGWSEDATELAVLKASLPKVPTIVGGGSKAAGGPDVYAASICLQAGVDAKYLADEYGEQTINAAMKRENRNVDFSRIAREILAANGERATFSRIDEGVIKRLANIEARAEMMGDVNAASGSNFTPISLSGILGDSARKALVSGFLGANVVCTKIASVKSAVDFKAFTWYRMTGVGSFQKLSNTGNFRATALQETSYSATLDTAGTIITLSRQEFINDDLGAFLDLPKILGRQAAIYQDKEAFTLLLSNPGSFFSTGTPRNYFEGAGTVLSPDSLATATQYFLEMKDENGDPTGLTPSILLVPPALAGTAQSIYKSPTLASGNTGKVPSTNIYAGTYEPVVSPHLGSSVGLSGNSDTAWYLLPDPALASVLVLAYLQGNQSPTIQDGVWQTSKLAMDFTAFFDFGCGMGEKRAGVKSKGAA